MSIHRYIGIESSIYRYIGIERSIFRYIGVESSIVPYIANSIHGNFRYDIPTLLVALAE